MRVSHWLAEDCNRRHELANLKVESLAGRQTGHKVADKEPVDYQASLQAVDHLYRRLNDHQLVLLDHHRDAGYKDLDHILIYHKVRNCYEDGTEY
jgi:hypothetical protein